MAEWRTEHAEGDGWPEVLFAVFADTSKTNLIDAFWFRNGTLTPLVDGAFSHSLRTIRKGDSVENLYRMAGKRQCDYFLSKSGRWCVRFVYFAYGGRIYVIEAEAAEGRITYANEGTM